MLTIRPWNATYFCRSDSIASARNLHRDLVECLDRNINQFTIPAEPANLGG